MNIQEIKGYAAVAGAGIASGTDVYAVTIPEIRALVFGLRILLLVPNANTTSCTLNLNGFGAKNIYKQVTSTLSVGDILQNQLIELAYDGTQWQLMGSAGAVSQSSSENPLFNYYNFR